MIRVAVNGYGTIGRRVADAVLKQKDMELEGVTKVRGDYRARLAVEKGLALYAADGKHLPEFAKAGIGT